MYYLPCQQSIYQEIIEGRGSEHGGVYLDITHLPDELIDEKLETMMKAFEKKCGDKIKISYKVLDKTKIEKDELDDVKDDIKDDYEDEKVKVSEGYNVCVKITVKGSDDKKTSYSTFSIYKINGKWCMIN